ncbi:MAG: leucine-rich repeat domain-containing protein [Clostridia bacterium]|nr:leucine-rich repeat domain-containing protein [Clostridia bacterium]
MKKNSFIVCLLLCMVLCLGFTVTSMAATVESGVCGENLTWDLDDTGKLTIEGTGAMTDWASSTKVPWYAKRSSIKTVVIGNSVTSIGEGAFYSCDSLTSITMGNSVTSIGERAFCYCYSLKSITMGNSVTSIGAYAFGYCESLTSITIPDSVTSIGAYAFSSCNSLTSITIPDSVTSIAVYAFYYCDSLTSITMGNSVTSIGEGAFGYCDSLTSITMGNSVTSIGERAFYYCESLTSITMGNSVTSIGERAFYDCDSLTDVYYDGSEEDWRKISFGSGNTNLTIATIHFLKTITAIEILATENSKLQVTVALDEPVAQTIVMVATYDAEGRFVGFVSQAVLADSQTAVLEVEAKNASEVKTLLWQGMGTMAPLSVADTKTIE